jgi:excisionase family DNA binding protein
LGEIAQRLAGLGQPKTLTLSSTPAWHFFHCTRACPDKHCRKRLQHLSGGYRKGDTMAKISVSEAAKRVDVARPTLQKHLKNGKISGEKVDGKGWQLDTAELVRAYQPRGGVLPDNLPASLSGVVSGLADDLKAENARLKADLAVAEALADERGKRLDQLVPLLTDQRKRRGWWPFG